MRGGKGGEGGGGGGEERALGGITEWLIPPVPPSFVCCVSLFVLCLFPILLTPNPLPIYNILNPKPSSDLSHSKHQS